MDWNELLKQTAHSIAWPCTRQCNYRKRFCAALRRSTPRTCMYIYIVWYCFFVSQRIFIWIFRVFNVSTAPLSALAILRPQAWRQADQGEGAYRTDVLPIGSPHLVGEPVPNLQTSHLSDKEHIPFRSHIFLWISFGSPAVLYPSHTCRLGAVTMTLIMHLLPSTLFSHCCPRFCNRCV